MQYWKSSLSCRVLNFNEWNLTRTLGSIITSQFCPLASFYWHYILEFMSKIINCSKICTCYPPQAPFKWHVYMTMWSPVCLIGFFVYLSSLLFTQLYQPWVYQRFTWEWGRRRDILKRLLKSRGIGLNHVKGVSLHKFPPPSILRQTLLIQVAHTTWYPVHIVTKPEF